jgi:hypothetical protein
MNESIRSLVFVGLAGIAGLAAWWTRPQVQQSTVQDIEVNRPLFPDFTDPLAAKSLEVVKFDEATAKFNPFKVAQIGGRWVIPSNDNYPADAENQLRDAASSLIDLEALGVASELVSEHSVLGVVEPNQSTLTVGDQGVGTLVAVQDAKGNDLMRLIVGKAVEGGENQHFVRKPSEEVVYVAKIDLTKLPTDFEKWIEKDLLKLNPLDVSKVTLKDYSIVPTQNGAALLPRMEATLTYDGAADVATQWTLDKMTVHSKEGEAREGGLTELEELNKQKLDDLRNALRDLKIVNVARKPDELGKLLKEGIEEIDQTQVESLEKFGFLLGTGPDRKLDVFATSGELVVDMKDGVRYTLRFGRIAGTQAATKTDGESSEDAADEAVKVNRFLFVSAQVSPATLTPPALEPETAGPEAPPATTPPTDTPAEEPSQSGGGGAEAQQPPADDDARPAEEAAPAEEAPPAAPAAVDPAAAERERVKRENERKMNEYREKRIKAEARVRELNSRFADWYYVVSEDVYKKLRLSRSDFVKEAAAAADEGFGVDAFRKLEDEGVEGKPAPPATPAPPMGGFPPGFPPM